MTFESVSICSTPPPTSLAPFGGLPVLPNPSKHSKLPENCDSFFGIFHDLTFISISKTGEIKAYDPTGVLVHALDLHESILLAKVSPHGLVLLITHKFYLISFTISCDENKKNPKKKVFEEKKMLALPISRCPLDLCVIAPDVRHTHNVSLAVTIPDQGGMFLAQMDKKSVSAKVPQFACLPVKILQAHPSEDVIATVDLRDRVLVVNLEWDQVLFARDCALGEPPIAMNWCMGGAGYAVALLWKETPWNVTAGDDAASSRFGPGAMVCAWTGNSDPADASAARFSFERPVGKLQDSFSAISEIDGTRVLCGNKLHLIRRVARSTQAVFGIGSTELSALLYDAVVNDDSASALTEYGMTRDELRRAADQVLDASKFELDPVKRASLLQAAKRGKDLSEEGSLTSTTGKDEMKKIALLTRKFVECVALAKIQTSCIAWGCSTATPIEILALSLTTFTNRVAACGFYDQALAIASMARIMDPQFTSCAPALKAFEVAKKNDNALLDRIVSKYPKISASASLYAQPLSTLKLCDKEPRLAQRLIALLRLDASCERALNLMLASKGVDFDLKARICLFCLAKRKDELIAAYPAVEAILTSSFVSSRNVARLEKWLISISSNKVVSPEKRARASNNRALLLCEAACSPELKFSDDATKSKRAQLWDEATKEFDASGRSFFANAVRDRSKLIQTQASYSMTTFTEKPCLADTVVDCVARGREDLAEKFRKQFNMKPALYWNCRVRGLGLRGQWAEAYRLVLSDPREAGKYVHEMDVFEMCFDSGAVSQAAKIAYEMRPTDPDKARAFAKLKMWPETLKFAEISRCADAIVELLSKCRNHEILTKAKVLVSTVELHAMPGEHLQVNTEPSSFVGLMAGALTNTTKEAPQRCQQQ